MCDNDTVYLVELKTTQDSIDEKQLDRYEEEQDKKTDSFASKKGEGYDFICLLNKVSRTGKPDDTFKESYNIEEDWLGQLDALFKHIITYKEKNGSGIEEGKYADAAKKYIKEKGAYSSKKYLFTAGQILDFPTQSQEGNDYKWWTYQKRKVLYLTPEEDERVVKRGFINVTFKKIIESKEISNRIKENFVKKVIGNEEESDNKAEEKIALENYWEWVVSMIEKTICT